MSTRTYAKPRYRKHAWLNTATGGSMHGIQASIEKGKWMHMAENGTPLIYESEADRDAKLSELRANAEPIPYVLSKIGSTP